MYNFIDTTGPQRAVLHHSEALNFNGEYIENIITGYQTLHVSGREMLESEVTDLQVGNADGSRYQGKRYPGRTITVTYQLIAESNKAFREAYNKLNSLLDAEQAKLIFSDEPDKYFIGTKASVGSVEPGRNSIIGEFEIYCADPFKYSVEEKEVLPVLDDGLTFAVDYQGTYPAFPVLEAVANGDNGLIGFIKDDSRILQFGNPDETDGEVYEQNEHITNSPIYLTWSEDPNWIDDTGPNFLHASSMTSGAFGVVDVGDGYKNLKLMDSGIGTTPNLYGWNGAMKSIPVADSNGKHGAKSVYTYVNSWFETELMGQTGCQAIAFCDENGKMICCQEIFKNDMSGNTAHMCMWVGGNRPRVVRDIAFEPAYWDSANPYNRGRGHSDMLKQGDLIRFYWWGAYPEFIIPELKDVEVHSVKLYIGQYGYRNLSNQFVTRNYFRGISVSISHVQKWRDVPNKFADNSILSVDCSNGEVLLQGLPAYGLGALGNDWEQFCLVPGTNQIKCIYSSWAQKPDFKLRYREVYL